MTSKNFENKTRLKIRLATMAVCFLAFNGLMAVQATELSDDQQIESEIKDETYNSKGEGRRGGHPRGPMPMSRLLDKLDVSDEQRDSVREIFREQRDQMYALRSGAEDQFDAERAATKAETRERLAAVLTDDQLAKYDEMQERRKQGKHRKYSQQETL